jgi:uncharacterized repeat protein (TIGR01451 family)
MKRLYLALLGLSAFTLGVLNSSSAHALGAGAVNITYVSDDLLVVDSNYCSSLKTPKAAYVGFKIKNPSTTATLNNLKVTLSDLGSFYFEGGQVPEQFIGSLAPLAERTVYWYVGYNPICNGSKVVFINSTIKATVSDANTGSVSGTALIKTDSYISSASGGLIKSTVLGPGYIAGQIINYDVEYSFGNTQTNDRLNIQPAGNETYNAACFQVVGSEVLLSQIPGITVGSKDKLFYLAAGNQNGSDNRVRMRYFVKYLCSGVSTLAKPYAGQTSGAQLKYSSNFNDVTIGVTLPVATNPFTITKTSLPTAVAPGDTVTYTVTIKNTSLLHDSYLDRITDVLPAGFSFSGIAVGSDVTTLNSGSYPAINDVGTLNFAAIPPLNYKVPANTSIKLIYTAKAASTIGAYNNSVTAQVGAITIGPAIARVTVGGADLGLVKTVDNTTPTVGSMVTFTVTLTNSGPQNATGIQIGDLIPAGLTNVTVTPSNGTYSNGVWSLASLAKNAVVTLTMTGTVNTFAPIVNTATITAASTTDLNADNNQASASLDAPNPPANVLLVKRITAINGNRSQNPNDSTRLDEFVNDTTSSHQTDDDNGGWPANYLLGAINGGKVKPGDAIEYTIYYLNIGGMNASKVRICDRIRGNQTFIRDTYPDISFLQTNAANPNPLGFGMQLLIGPRNGIPIDLSNVDDSSSRDRGQFIATSSTPPTNCRLPAFPGGPDKGMTVLDLTGTSNPNLTNIPYALSNNPTNSYGFWRFTTRVDAAP